MTSRSTSEPPAPPVWQQRTVQTSPAVLRSQERSIERAKLIVLAAHRLIATKGASFTTQELAKEAGVALQTFYTYFGSKDQVLLAVLEELVAHAMADLERAGNELSEPLARLHLYVTSLVKVLPSHDGNWAAFVTAERWRLHQLYPDEMSRALKPVVDLMAPEIRRGRECGLLRSDDPGGDAWLISQLVSAVFHHFPNTAIADAIDELAERVWLFCLSGLGGSRRAWSER